MAESTPEERIESPAVPARKPGATSRPRLRAYLIGLALIPPTSWWVISCEDVGRGPYATTISLFANAVFILALLVAANSCLARLGRKWALTQAELLITYVMTCVAASMAGLDMISVVMQVIAHSFRFASPENRWMELFGGYLPRLFVVSDPAALKGYYEGHSTLYNARTVWAWLVPVGMWTGFLAALLFVMMCVNTLVRRQWSDRERLTFPIIQLPMAMTEPGGALWRNKWMWLGFAVAGGINLINGLAFYYPNVPSITVKHFDIGYLVTAKPWDAIGWTPISFYPFVIGLGFLLPADLSFSCWFFYLFWKAELVAARAMAWDASSEFPYLRQQGFGGVMAILVLLIWSGRPYLGQLWRAILGGSSELDEAGEGMSYRTAAAGVMLGTAALVAFARLMGLSPVVALPAFAIYFAVSTAIARMRAEFGPPVHDLHWSGPDAFITQAVGTHSLSARDLTALDMFWGFNRAYRGHPMPIGIESMKMASESRATQRSFLAAFMLAGLVGSISAFWVYLHLAYTKGVASFNQGIGFGNETYTRLQSWIQSPTGPNTAANLATVVGFACCLFLGLMRISFYGWPFHPIGFAISGNWSINLVWLPILIAWLAKVSVMRFGGMRLYRSSIPFFLGLILGETTVGSAWSVLAIALGIPAYSFWGA